MRSTITCNVPQEQQGGVLSAGTQEEKGELARMVRSWSSDPSRPGHAYIRDEMHIVQVLVYVCAVSYTRCNAINITELIRGRYGHRRHDQDNTRPQGHGRLQRDV